MAGKPALSRKVQSPPPGRRPLDAARLRRRLEEVSGLCELFKVLADETRTRILYLLGEREMCVCDLAGLLGMSLPAVSHHLRLLKAARLARSRKEGKHVFYRLHDGHVVALIRQAREHFSHGDSRTETEGDQRR